MRTRSLMCLLALGTALTMPKFADAQTIRAVMTTPDFGHMIYETLFSLDENGEPQPQMVRDHQISKDELTHTFNLRDGLAFHDGAPVTAEDVVASLNRWASRDPIGKTLSGLIEDIRAVDETTFEVVLNEPSGLLPTAFAKPANIAAYIMPKAQAEVGDNSGDLGFIGSGAFEFVEDEWRPGDRIVFQRNEGYKPREEEPSGLAGAHIAKVDRVEWVTMPDPQQQVNALQTGEVDYLQMPLSDLFPLIEADDSVALVETNELGRQLVFRFNWLTEPFDDPKIRQAAWSALNQTDFLQGVIGNPDYYNECYSVFACGTPWKTNAGMDGLVTSNFDRSKALLEDAGYDGTPVVIPQFTGLGSNVGPIAKDLLERGGFSVDLQYMDGEAWDARVASKAPADQGGWSAVVRSQNVLSMLNPVDVPMLDASCDTAQPGWPCDETLEELRAQFLRAGDEEERRRLAADIQLRAIEVSPYVPLGQYNIPIGVRASLDGILNAVVPVFWNIEKTDG